MMQSIFNQVELLYIELSSAKLSSAKVNPIHLKPQALDLLCARNQSESALPGIGMQHPAKEKSFNPAPRKKRK